MLAQDEIIHLQNRGLEVLPSCSRRYALPTNTRISS